MPLLCTATEWPSRRANPGLFPSEAHNPPRTTAASCLSHSGHKGPPGQDLGGLFQAGAAPATPEAIPRYGKGWPPRNTWVLVPKSTMIARPAGNHGHQDTNNWEGRQVTSAPAPASSVPLCAGGRLGLAHRESQTQEGVGCLFPQYGPCPLSLSCSSPRKPAK